MRLETQQQRKVYRRQEVRAHQRFLTSRAGGSIKHKWVLQHRYSEQSNDADEDFQPSATVTFTVASLESAVAINSRATAHAELTAIQLSAAGFAYEATAHRW